MSTHRRPRHGVTTRCSDSAGAAETTANINKSIDRPDSAEVNTVVAFNWRLAAAAGLDCVAYLGKRCHACRRGRGRSVERGRPV